MSTYRDLEDELLSTVVCLEGVENRRKLVGVEFYCVETSAPSPHHVSSFVSIFHAIRSLLSRPKKILSLTIHNGTNNLMDLAMKGRVTREARTGSPSIQ